MSIGIYICYKKVVRGENCSDILSVGENDVYYTFIFKVLCKVYYYILYAMANAYCNISFLLLPPLEGNLNITIHYLPLPELYNNILLQNTVEIKVYYK